MRGDQGGLSRRSFVGGALAAGAAAVVPPSVRAAVAPGGPRPGTDRPNILFVMVDQLREPVPMPGQPDLDAALPNLARLRDGAVRFGGHYTAANMCTPSRGALLTGLYPHQTGCLVTGLTSELGSVLSPRFPTWGSMLRDMGYETSWWGKWHLAHTCDMERYGFSGGTCPSPDGGPGEGQRRDGSIVDQFRQWFDAKAGDGPWCTAVSLVNPHDVAWWPGSTRTIVGQRNPPRLYRGPAPNFETPEQLLSKGKPRMQVAWLQGNQFGGVATYRGAVARYQWTRLLDTYLALQRMVDVQIGRILDTLQSRPEIARNTVIVFTSDHGEYAGAHGMRNKGGAAYEEGLHIPLYVKDPRGTLTSRPDIVRPQLTSSVDIAGLLLTIASGSQDWRTDQTTDHLAGRADLAAICADPAAGGRPWIAHTCDEDFDYLTLAGAVRNAPSHITAIRTPTAKLATYRHWRRRSIDIRSVGEEAELYDYRTAAGRAELETVIGKSPLEDPMRELLDHAMATEIRAPLPTRLHAAQAAGMADYRSRTFGT